MHVVFAHAQRVPVDSRRPRESLRRGENGPRVAHKRESERTATELSLPPRVKLQYSLRAAPRRCGLRNAEIAPMHIKPFA